MKFDFFILYKSIGNLREIHYNNMNPAKRLDTIISRYIDARLSESESNIYTIRLINKDDYEGYYILLKPKSGVFKDCNFILSMRTNEPNNSKSSTELFPNKPPKMHFVSSCYHTNVGTTGWICLDTLMSNWVPTYSFITIIQNILIFLETPNTSSPANCEASKDWSICEKEFLRQTKNKNLTVKEEDEIRENCFSEYISKLKTQNNSKNFTKYFKYFPELNPKLKEEDLQDIMLEQEEFNNLVNIVNEKAEKKKVNIQNRNAKAEKVEKVESKNISIIEMKKMQISKLAELIEEFSELKVHEENINSDNNNIIDLLNSIELEKSADKNLISIKKVKVLELEYKTKLENYTNNLSNIKESEILSLIIKTNIDIITLLTDKEEQVMSEVKELNKRKKKWSKYQNTSKVREVPE